MNKLFNPDSFLFQLLERVADFFLISALTAICCLPIFTIGAAITTSHKVAQNIIMGNEQPVIKSYFEAFTKNFKQATLFWLIAALILALLALNLSLTFIYFDGNVAMVLYFAVGVTGGIALGTLAYTFPLIARYENTFKQHLRNSFFLAIGMLPKTVLILALTAIPVGIAIYSLEYFVNTLFVWGLFGFGILIYLQARLICPIFTRLEEAQNKNESDAQDSEQEEA